MKKPIPHREVVFGNTNLAVAKARSIGRTVVESLDTAMGSKLTREMAQRPVKDSREQAELSILDFTNGQEQALGKAPKGLEIEGQGDGFTVNAHVDGSPGYPTFPARTYWALRVIHNKTKRVSLFSVATGRNVKDFDHSGQNEVLQIQTMDPKTGAAYRGWSYNKHDETELYKSVNTAFSVLTTAEREGTLRRIELPGAPEVRSEPVATAAPRLDQ